MASHEEAAAAAALLALISARRCGATTCMQPLSPTRPDDSACAEIALARPLPALYHHDDRQTVARLLSIFLLPVSLQTALQTLIAFFTLRILTSKMRFSLACTCSCRFCPNSGGCGSSLLASLRGRKREAAPRGGTTSSG